MKSFSSSVFGPLSSVQTRLKIATAFLLLAFFGWLIRDEVSERVSRIDAAADEADWGESTPTTAFPLLETRQIKKAAFFDGEVLQYKVKYKGMTVGNAVLSAQPGPTWNGRATVKLVSTAKSTPFFDRIFRVRDRTVSLVDHASFSTIRFGQDLNEGGKHIERSMNVNYIDNRFTGRELLKGKESLWNGTVETPMNDVLSAFFFVRTLPLNPGAVHTVRALQKGKATDIKITVGPKPRRIKTPAGTFQALSLTPDLKGDTIFGSKDGRLTVWVTDDARRMPILMEAVVSVGNVKVLLSGTDQPTVAEKDEKTPIKTASK
jgi:hypothetical protein